jgi:hypothetical protein
MEITGKYSSDESFEAMVRNYLSSFGPEYEIVVWGSGKSCKILINTIEKTHRIKYIVDINEQLWGGKKSGYEIKAPANLQNEDPNKVKVMIMPFGFVRYDIINALIKYGFNSDSFCFGNEYLVLHNYQYNNQLVIQNVGFFIGSACTLKCRDCIAHLTLYTKNRNAFIPFEMIKSDIDKTFSSIDFVNLITLSTGEIFLHPEIINIIEYLYTYKDRYNFIQTPTNGTVIPKPETLEIMKRCHIGIYISDYSHSIGRKSKIPQLIEVFNQHKIVYEMFDNLQGGKSKIPLWSDIGDFSKARNRDEHETAQMYQKCANRAAQVVFDGKLYTCGSAQWGEFGGLYQANKNSDYADLSQSKTTILRAYFGATKTGYPNVCTQCDGIGPYANTKTVYAGIQV